MDNPPEDAGREILCVDQVCWVIRLAAQLFRPRLLFAIPNLSRAELRLIAYAQRLGAVPSREQRRLDLDSGCCLWRQAEEGVQAVAGVEAELEGSISAAMGPKADACSAAILK